MNVSQLPFNIIRDSFLMEKTTQNLKLQVSLVEVSKSVNCLV